MKEGYHTTAIMLDKKKAFDLIPHEFILQKLQYYGIQGKELLWFKNDYLTNRKQCVVINGTTSRYHPVKSGVPQGSVLNSNTNLVRLQRLQNKYIRLIFGVNRYHSVSFYRDDLKWQQIEERIKYQCCVLVYKILNGQAPNYLNRLLCVRPVLYHTRYALNSPLFVQQN